MAPRWLPGQWATPDDVSEIVKAALRPAIDSLADFRRVVMAKLEDFQAALAAVDAETTRIGTKVQELLDKLAAGGLSAEEESAVLAQLSAAAGRLKLIAADPENPVPPVDEPAGV